MKILLTNDFSKALMAQEKDVVDTFLASVKKLRDLTKTQIEASDAVIKMPLSKDRAPLFAYNVEGTSYAVFMFIKKNELLLIDYATLQDDEVVSLTYAETSTDEDD